jgi:imidazolonepropionase-like amidohydrolase
VLAHAIEDTRGFTADHLLRMIAQKMALIPTLHLFSQDSNIEDIRREVRSYEQAGGQVLFGTDVGFLTDYDPTDEFIQLARAGLTWQQILASLTTNPAARFGEASKRGRVATGLDADLVVIGHDPATDVRALADVIDVIRGGRVIFQNTQGGR